MFKLSRFAMLVLAAAACGRESTSPNDPMSRSASLSLGGSDVGAVYTQSNSASGNAVIVFGRSADGTLTPAGSFATLGNGTGAGLGSQGAVTLSDDGAYLFAVNAASNSITSFSVEGTDLTRISTVPSGGTLPISITVHGDILYVLNAGDDTISIFGINRDGSLSDLGKVTGLAASSVGLAGR